MKHILVALLPLLIAAASCGNPGGAGEYGPCEAPRSIPAGMEALSRWEFSIDGKDWTKVTVPHSYNAEDGHSASYYRGPASYRCNIDIRDPEEASYLIFEGAGQKASVFVNGQPACDHRGGYTAFCVKLKGLVHKGANSIEVVCDNTEDLELIPVSSDFNKNGGLHYPVWLFKPRKAHFSPDAYGLYRMHVCQDSVCDSLAAGRVKACLEGRGDVLMRILDKQGAVVLQESLQGVSGEFEIPFSIPSPHLWNGLSDPYLYTVELSAGSDKAVTETGFRYYSMSRDQGFFLNGKSYPLRGVCMHQDLIGKASALSWGDIDSDYAIVRELGCNFLRLAHYPHNDYAFRLCDRMGIVVQTEIPWVDACGENATEAYFGNIRSQMREMIVNLYNHPSIFFWGMWNELRGNKKIDAFQGPLDTGKVTSETARLYDTAKAADSSRPVGLTDCTVFQRDGYTSLKADYFSENKYYGWYTTYGDFSGVTPMMEWIRDNMGPCNLSEYGAGVNPFCHTWKEEDICRYADDKRHVEEYGNLSHEAHAQQIALMPWLNFTSIWILFDFPVASRTEGFTDSSDGVNWIDNPERLYMNDKGLITRDRATRKDTFYLYKSWWNSSEETVYITGRRLLRRPADEEFTLTVYSNSPSLRLLQDGEEVASMQSSGESTGVIWKFPGLRIKASGSEFTVISPSGTKDSVRFDAL